MCRHLLDDLTAVIKTFQRPRSLDLLIASIRRFYPELKILVADDGFTPCPRNNVEYVQLAPDVGVSAGRNALLKRIETPYFLLLDDDLEFTAETTIQRLMAPVTEGMIDLAAGDYIRCKRRLFFVRHKPQPYHGLLDLHNGHLSFVHGHRGCRSGYLRCDIVHNFFVARTEQIRALGGWNEELKIQEHEEFFLRLKHAGLRVAFCPEVRVQHWNARPAGYSRFRNRDYGGLAAEKMHIHQFTDVLGRTFVYAAKAA